MTQTDSGLQRDVSKSRMGLMRRLTLLLPVLALLYFGAAGRSTVNAIGQITVVVSASGVGASLTGASSPYQLSTPAGVAVQLIAQAGGGTCVTPNYTYTWSFGDNITGTGQVVSHSWAQTPLSPAYLIVTDVCGDATGVAQINVTVGGGGATGCTPSVGAPSVSVIAVPSNPQPNASVTFIATTGGFIGSPLYSWAFGDGITIQSQTGGQTQHIYAASGTYTVTVAVSTGTLVGCGTTIVVVGSGTGTGTNSNIRVAPNGPYSGNVGQTINFGGSAQTSNSGATITSFQWNFGDNATATGQYPTHAYNAIGTYTVTLTVSDSSGQSSSATTLATIGGGSGSTTGGTTGQNSERGVTVSTGGPYTGSPNSAINFSGTATTTNVGATINSFTWNFGDGSVGVGQNTSHTYTSAGTYTLVLTVTDTTGVAVAASAQVVIGGGSGSSSGGTRQVQLVTGCNNVASTFPDNTQMQTIAQGVSPSSALLSFWKLSNPSTSQYKAWFPGSTQASDLVSLNKFDAFYICVNNGATLSEPAS